MNKTVLIVEDEPITQKLLSTICERKGFKVVIVDNAKDAVREAKARKPFLSIVDMELKCSRGIDFINKIKVGLGLDTKIIVHSGNLEIFRYWKDLSYEAELELEKGVPSNYRVLNSFLAKAQAL